MENKNYLNDDTRRKLKQVANETGVDYTELCEAVTYLSEMYVDVLNTILELTIKNPSFLPRLQFLLSSLNLSSCQHTDDYS